MPKKRQLVECIPEAKFKSLLKKVEAHYKDGQAAAGGAGELISNASEYHHLHKKAFSVFRQLNRMSPEKLADFLDHFDYYRDIGGLDEIAASAPRFDVIEGGAVAAAE